jgi:hypothetical protein
MVVVHFEMKWISCRLMKQVTQLLLSSVLATKEEKFLIISLVGGRPLFVSPMMYCTSSNSCWELSFCCFESLTFLGSVTRWCLWLSVEQFTSYWEATCVYKIFSPGLRDSIYSITAEIGFILVELEVIAIGVRRCVLVFCVHCANPCTACMGTLIVGRASQLGT